MEPIAIICPIINMAAIALSTAVVVAHPSDKGCSTQQAVWFRLHTSLMT